MRRKVEGERRERGERVKKRKVKVRKGKLKRGDGALQNITKLSSNTEDLWKS